MDIFILNRNNFLIKDKTLDFLNQFNSLKRRREYFLSRFLLNFVSKNFYNIKSAETEVINKKPQFRFSDLQFSISHSHDYIAICFDNNPIGFDIEKIKPRNYMDILEHFKVNKEFTQDQFYQFWTLYESKIKLQQNEILSKSSVKIFENYIMSIVSNQSLSISKTLKIYELKSPKLNVKPIELTTLNPVNDNIKNENTVVIQEINTASFEYLEPLNLNIE